MIGFGGVAKVPPFLFLRDGRLQSEPLQAARRRVFGVYEWYALRTKNSCISTWFHVCLFHIRFHVFLFGCYVHLHVTSE